MTNQPPLPNFPTPINATTEVTLFTCPVCGQDIKGSAMMEFTLTPSLEDGGQEVRTSMYVELDVCHRCSSVRGIRRG